MWLEETVRSITGNILRRLSALLSFRQTSAPCMRELVKTSEVYMPKKFPSSLFRPQKHSDPETFAVIFGWFITYYPGASPAKDRDNIRGMLIQEHAPKRFHVISFFSLDRKWRNWAKSLKQHRFNVGGPKIIDETT